jgi:ergothioneine biosynthesis protein EgtB
VTNGEYLEFVRDNGYRRPELWLSDGFRWVREHDWQAPLYWSRGVNDTHVYTLAGAKSLSLSEPVCHVSYYEADAFARWAGARVPTEYEWENAAAEIPVVGNLLDPARIHPRAAVAENRSLHQMFGDTWEWTASAYSPYPGYRPAAGALGEYNGKFMCNQMVLRGGSCATPSDHIRASYRNFFPAEARWQFTGIRLARSA